MKNLEEKIVSLLIRGHCTPQLLALTRTTREPSTTLHYNLKKLQSEKKMLSCKAVFDYSKIGRCFCSYVLVTLSSDEYGNPERIAKELSVFDEVESVDVVTGDCELVMKVRTKDISEYYNFIKSALSRKGIIKVKSLNSLKSIKSEFVVFPDD